MSETADPYAPPPPPFWVRWPDTTVAGAVAVLTAVATALSFPPFHSPEFAYAFAAPAIFWAYRRPSLKLYAGAMAVAQIAAWLAILVWLRHVSWTGWILLGTFVGLWVGVWYLAVWWAMPRMVGRSTPVRLGIQLGLAALWVVVEWTRTWLLTGFPWLPLAASQWQRTSVLQIASYTGAWGVSFVLITVNVGFAAYGHRLFFEERTGFNKRSQEFFLALFLLLACLCVHVTELSGSARRIQPLARVAFVQPDIPQSVKWEADEGPKIVATLGRLTALAARTEPDLILWPESAFPWPVNAEPDARVLVERMAVEAKAPILFGANAVRRAPDGTERWYDAAFVVSPDRGLEPTYYAKRHLVPFGEYIPWRFLFGWLSKVVPIGSDFFPGEDPSPLLVPLRTGDAALGPLICYEDVFPDLARSSVRFGADALVVLTNDAWYGEEGAAYQHAAHSVLRAVEMRRPVLRCGNAGWSGWIDEYGGTGQDDHPHVLTSETSGVYFRGTRTLDVVRDSKWIGRQSFYCRHGDWFVVLSALLAVFGYALAATSPCSRGR